jgi:hypothetical protein
MYSREGLLPRYGNQKGAREHLGESTNLLSFGFMDCIEDKIPGK